MPCPAGTLRPVLLLAILLAPASATAQESTVTLSKDDIAAPAERLFPLLQDFRRWNLWSPHGKASAAVRRYFDDPLYGKGASYSWEGDTAFGAGRARITDATAPVLGAPAAPATVSVTLDLARPVSGRVFLRFTLRPVENRTQLTATLSGPTGLVARMAGQLLVDGGLLGPSCAVDGSPREVCRSVVGDKVDGNGS